jgi:uncharacterized damage-inducible protein DinB
MTIKDLERLYNYHYWANNKLFKVVSQLTPGQFTQSVAGSYGSIRNTLAHVLSAEWVWLDRYSGPARGTRPQPDDFPTLESLIDTWSKVEEQIRGFLSGLHDEDLSRRVEFIMSGDIKASRLLGELIQHAAMHAVHHRGQVALLLRALGYAPGNFDLFLYDAERQNVPAM